MTDVSQPQETEGETRYEAARFGNPHQALSVLVQLSLRAPAFATQGFGQWARVLVGMVNRGDYLVLKEDGQPVGFAGWFPARKSDAEAWLTENRDIPAVPLAEADCVVVNAVHAPTPEAVRILRDRCIAMVPGIDTIYGKRVKGKERRLVRLPTGRYMLAGLSGRRLQ